MCESVQSLPPIFVCAVETLMEYCPKIFSRISVLSQWCGDFKASFIHACIGDEKQLQLLNEKIVERRKEKRKQSACPNCKSFIVFYVEEWEEPPESFKTNKPIDKRLEFVEKTCSEDITSSFTLRCFPDQIWEIWDVCTEPISRGKGNMKKMMTRVLAMPFVSKVWLSIDLRNPLFYIVCELYLNMGFRNPSIISKTPHNQMIPTPLLQLLYNKQNPTSETDVFQQLKECIDLRIAQNDKVSRIPIHIHNNIVSTIFQGAEANTLETGGSLFKDTIITIRDQSNVFDKKNVVNLCALRGAERVGTISSVDVPIFSLISFHIHSSYVLSVVEKNRWRIPKQFDDKFENNPHLWGWPSGSDFHSVFYTFLQFPKCIVPSSMELVKFKNILHPLEHSNTSQLLGSLIKHFVFSYEGVYSLQLTPEFQTFLDVVHSEKIKKKIGKAIENQFGMVEWLRFNQQQYMIQKFLSFSNAFTMSQLLKETIFPWDVIYQNQVDDEATEYVKQQTEIKTEELSSLRKSLCLQHIETENDFPLFTVRFFPEKELSQKAGLVDTIDIPSSSLHIVLALLEKQNLAQRAKYEISKSVLLFRENDVLGRWTKGEITVPHATFLRFPQSKLAEMTQNEATVLLEKVCQKKKDKMFD